MLRSLVPSAPATLTIHDLRSVVHTLLPVVTSGSREGGGGYSLLQAACRSMSHSVRTARQYYQFTQQHEDARRMAAAMERLTSGDGQEESLEEEEEEVVAATSSSPSSDDALPQQQQEPQLPGPVLVVEALPLLPPSLPPLPPPSPPPPPPRAKRRRCFTAEEDATIEAGVSNGESWVAIARRLARRSNVDVKDRWVGGWVGG